MAYKEFRTMSKRFFILSTLGLGIGGIKYFTMGGKNNYSPDMDGKVVVVTGGNTGIGKETVRELLRLHSTVIFTGRDAKKAQGMVDEIIREHQGRNRRSPEVVFIPVDYSDLESVKVFASTFLNKYTYLHALVNNAGQYNSEQKVSRQGVEMTMAVNYLAPVYLTHLLMPALQRTPDSRVINVASMAHEGMTMTGPKYEPNMDDFLLDKMIAEKKYNAGVAYTNSKLANIYFTKGLDKYFQRKGLQMKTASLHPGVVRTELTRGAGMLQYFILPFYPLIWLATKSEFEGAQTTLATTLMPFNKLTSGAYYSDCEVKTTSPASTNQAHIDKAWNESIERLKKLTGEKTIFGQ